MEKPWPKAALDRLWKMLTQRVCAECGTELVGPDVSDVCGDCAARFGACDDDAGRTGWDR